jgi:SAM-dependent methyltransferase
VIFDRCIYRLPATELETYWEDTWAGKDFDRMVSTQLRKDWWGQLEALASTLGGGELVLEAGCGAAPVVFLLHHRGYRVRGVDVAGETIARIKRLHPELDLHVQDVEHLDLPDGSVGLYVSLGVVEHDPDGPGGILAEAARVTRDHGLAFLTVPYLNVFRRLREPWWRVKHLLHRTVGQKLLGRPELRFYQYAFSRAVIERQLTQHGFELLEVSYCHTPVALKKDLGDKPWFRRAAVRDGRLDPVRVKQIAERLDGITPRLMSHVLAISARRNPRSGAGRLDDATVSVRSRATAGTRR